MASPEPETEPAPGPPAPAPKPVAASVTLGRGAGTHYATLDATGALVVIWYHHGPDADYEFAKELHLPVEAVAALCRAMEVAEADVLPALAARFQTYWQAKEFIEAHAIAFDLRTDWWP